MVADAYVKPCAKRIMSIVFYELLPMTFFCLCLGIYHDRRAVCHTDNIIQLKPFEYLIIIGTTRLGSLTAIFTSCISFLFWRIDRTTILIVGLCAVCVVVVECFLLVLIIPIIFQNNLAKLAADCPYIIHIVCLLVLSVFNFISLLKICKLIYEIYLHLITDEVHALLAKSESEIEI